MTHFYKENSKPYFVGLLILAIAILVFSFLYIRFNQTVVQAEEERDYLSNFGGFRVSKISNGLTTTEASPDLVEDLRRVDEDIKILTMEVDRGEEFLSLLSAQSSRDKILAYLEDYKNEVLILERLPRTEMEEILVDIAEQINLIKTDTNLPTQTIADSYNANILKLNTALSATILDRMVGLSDKFLPRVEAFKRSSDPKYTQAMKNYEKIRLDLLSLYSLNSKVYFTPKDKKLMVEELDKIEVVRDDFESFIASL